MRTKDAMISFWQFELEKVRILCERIVKREKIKVLIVLLVHYLSCMNVFYSMQSVSTGWPFVLSFGNIFY